MSAIGGFILVLTLVGCSAATGEPATSPEPSTASAELEPSAEPTPLPETTEAAAPANALDVASALQVEVPTIIAITEVTEINDSNGLIGRPGQYTSAAWITDSAADQAQTGIDGGAVVEVFANPEDAQARSDYIQSVLQGAGGVLGTEYHYMDGMVLLRVSGVLMPSQAAVYQAAFDELVVPGV